MRVLLLNSDWTPLNFVSCVRAIKLLIKGRAEVINLGDRLSLWNFKLTTTTSSYDVPATLRLVERVHRKYMPPRFRKTTLFNRDAWQCQYCGVSLDRSSITIDHVIPRSRGGVTSWRNCVASCERCNIRKGSRTLSETGMKLRKNPVEPNPMHFWESGRSVWHDDWFFFFSGDSYMPCTSRSDSSGK
jgi:5-methylcytosine-specific restriction endonuclease McrA